MSGKPMVCRFFVDGNRTLLEDKSIWLTQANLVDLYHLDEQQLQKTKKKKKDYRL